MNIYECCQNDKLMVIALKSLADEYAAESNLDLTGSISNICKIAGVNRTQVYEKKAQLKEGLKQVHMDGPGRPPKEDHARSTLSEGTCELKIKVLRYRLENPGIVVPHCGGKVSYSNGFKRYVLDHFDQWEGCQEEFCRQVEVPLQTFMTWKKADAQKKIERLAPKKNPALSPTASEDARAIVMDYARWQGSLRDFLPYEAKRRGLNFNEIRRVLTITGMLPIKSGKPPRYRGTTEKVQPGGILVTDGKEAAVEFTSSGKKETLNWQGIVDQATACHTATVVTKTEDAKAVRKAYHDSVEMIGSPPGGMVHDNKPIHKDKRLCGDLEKMGTEMIPATLKRPENKAVMEGEFGKFEQHVGTIRIDDQNEGALSESIVREVIRAYTAGINHAGRFEFDGKSRMAVLKQACPDPAKDRAFIEQLKGRHDQQKKQNILPTVHAATAILNKGFSLFNLQKNDPKGTLRAWLASTYTPEAIKQGLAIFGTEREKGRLSSKMAHRYLVKVIQNAQNEIDLRLQEELLREFGQIHRKSWIHELEQEFVRLSDECQRDTVLENDLAFRLSEKAAFGCIIIQRDFWLNKLKSVLMRQPDRIRSVCRHVRRLFEVDWNDRFQLISRLITWELQLSE